MRRSRRYLRMAYTTFRRFFGALRRTFMPKLSGVSQNTVNDCQDFLGCNFLKGSLVTLVHGGYSKDTSMSWEDSWRARMSGKSRCFRVIEFRSPTGDVWRSIHEVLLVKGVPRSYSVDPAVVEWAEGEGDRAAFAALERMHQAVALPVLRLRDFGSD